jgi:hypothetical protein
MAARLSRASVCFRRGLADPKNAAAPAGWRFEAGEEGADLGLDSNQSALLEAACSRQLNVKNLRGKKAKLRCARRRSRGIEGNRGSAEIKGMDRTCVFR